MCIRDRYQSNNTAAEDTLTTLTMHEVYASWTDGPCKSCLCLPSEDSNHPTAECEVTACPAVPSDEEINYELEEQRVPGECCPTWVRTACKEGGVVFKVRITP